MSLVTVSSKRNRVYPRKFDHEEVQRRFATGEVSISSLAREFGVSPSAISRVVNPRIREKMNQHNLAHMRSGVCIDCGKEGISPSGRTADGPRCRACAAKNSATSVRTDTLRCTACRKWLPDEKFPRSRAMVHRRGRHGQCKKCSNESRTAYRNRHKIPCENGCGNLVEGKGRPTRGGEDRPFLCPTCWHEMSIKRRDEVTQFVILEETEEKTWEIRGELEANNRSEALNRLFDGVIPDGRIVIIGGQAWKPGRVVPVQKLDIQTEAKA